MYFLESVFWLLVHPSCGQSPSLSHTQSALFVSVVQAVLAVLQLYDFVTGAVSVVYGLGLVEAAAVEQLVEESQSRKREHGEDEEEEDYKAGNIPAIMEGEDLLHWSSVATGHSHGDLEGGKDKNKERWGR